MPPLSDAGATLLATMGSRGGWTVDRLVETTGFGVGVVTGALLELRLAGQAVEHAWCCWTATAHG